MTPSSSTPSIPAQGTPDNSAHAALETAHETQVRKADHLRICLDEDVQFHRTGNGLDRYRFVHCCLPELDYQDLVLSTTFLGKFLGAPLLISSMTGGTEQARLINTRLSEVAQQTGRKLAD